jgi:hypothetical protein
MLALVVKGLVDHRFLHGFGCIKIVDFLGQLVLSRVVNFIYFNRK